MSAERTHLQTREEDPPGYAALLLERPPLAAELPLLLLM
jgi:hypothetical protein